MVAVGVAAMLVSRSASATVDALPFPNDLHRDATGAGGARLVVVLFSLPDCPYCEAIRREQLLPLSLLLGRQRRLIVREVSISGARPLVGFDGRPTNESAFAKRSAARFSPTVAFFGPTGEQVGESIVGALLADFYGAYLDKAVHVGLSKIEGMHR